MGRYKAFLYEWGGIGMFSIDWGGFVRASFSRGTRSTGVHRMLSLTVRSGQSCLLLPLFFLNGKICSQIVDTLGAIAVRQYCRQRNSDAEFTEQCEAVAYRT